MPEKVYRVFQPARPRFAFEQVAVRSVPDHQGMNRPTAAGQLRRRLDQCLEMLHRVETRDGADDQRVGRQCQSSPQVGRGVRCGLRAQVDAVVDDLDPALGQALGHHVPFQVVRHRRDAGLRRARSTGFSRRRLRDGGASESRPCSVNTIRRPGRARRARRAIHERRVLMTVEHVGFHLPRDGRQTSRQRWVEPRLARQRGDRRAGGLERLAPGPSGIETTHGLPRLAAKSLDQFEHKPFGAAWVEGEDDLED